MDLSNADFPNSVTSQLLEEYNKQFNLILKRKFELLKRKAYKQGEIQLFTILRNIDLSNIAKTKFELERRGYILELEQPQPKTEFTNNGYIFKATIEADQIKLKVKKTILEV